MSAKSQDSLNITAKLLEVPVEELQAAMTTRVMSAGGTDMRLDGSNNQILCCINLLLLCNTKI